VIWFTGEASIRSGPRKRKHTELPQSIEQHQERITIQEDVTTTKESPIDATGAKDLSTSQPAKIAKTVNSVEMKETVQQQLKIQQDANQKQEMETKQGSF
jgi:hypothetical protein